MALVNPLGDTVSHAHTLLNRSFLSAELTQLVTRMTLKEKMSLLAGSDSWCTMPIPRLDIPRIKMNDGPNGARGESFFHACPALAFPCETCLGASFSTELVQLCGSLLAAETKARNAVCLLGPTVNIQRSPLGGRAYESFSEDPTVSGLLAAAYIRGLQDHGVSACIKHFVGNDQEHERTGADSIIQPRALREIYLKPFMLAERLAKPEAYMTSYNKINGVHSSESHWLLQRVLREEWKFDGVVISDWGGTYSISDSVNAGLNLEMPGPARYRTVDILSHQVTAHKIDPQTIDTLVLQILQWIQRLAIRNEQLAYNPPREERTRTECRKADEILLRRAAGEGIVLLKNDNVLPVKTGRVLVIGEHAKSAFVTGGGSAQVRAAWVVTPWEGLCGNKPPEVELSYTLGAPTGKFSPLLNGDFTCPDGSPGVELRHFSIVDGTKSDQPVVVAKYHSSSLFLPEICGPGDMFFTELHARFTSPIDGQYEFGLCTTGQGKLWIDNELIVDTSSELPRGESFFGRGSAEVKGSCRVQKGKTYKVTALHDTRRPAGCVSAYEHDFNGMRIGAIEKTNTDAMTRAIDFAQESDTIVIFAGLNGDLEAEGTDRPNLKLPSSANRLIEEVSAVHPNTVVMLQAGSAVSMPWLHQVKGVVFAWYGGNESGNAIADVLYGIRNPSGRLPLSFPKREIDIAAHLTHKSARKRIYYNEDMWMGYKHHNARGIAPLFPFGHGLSYTTFEYSALSVRPPTGPVPEASDWSIKVEVTLTNTGDLAGDHSVHFYAQPPPETPTGLRHPEIALVAFEKVYNLRPGEQRQVCTVLDKYAVSHWDEETGAWRVELGEWTVSIGRDAQTMIGAVKFRIDQQMAWRGL